MSNISKRVVTIGVAAMSAGLIWAPPTPSFASGSDALLFAQANDPKGKPDNNTGRPSTPSPSGQPNGQPNVQSPSPTLQPSPQSGVPARCASVVNAAERQKCMNTPKGR